MAARRRTDNRWHVDLDNEPIYISPGRLEILRTENEAKARIRGMKEFQSYKRHREEQESKTRDVLRYAKKRPHNPKHDGWVRNLQGDQSRPRARATHKPVVKKGTKFTLLWLIGVVCAAMGLTYQLFDLTWLYLKYEVITEINVQAPVQHSMPGFSACFPYTKLLIEEQVEKFFPSPSFNLLDLVKRNRVSIGVTQNNLTVADIFKLTPEVSQAFLSCQYRVPNRYYLVKKSQKQDCYAFFNVQKFFKQQYICYAFIPKNITMLYFYENIVNSLSWPGLFLAITLDTTFFNQSAEIQVQVHENTVLPRGNKAFPILLSRQGLRAPLTDDPKSPKVTSINDHFLVNYVAITNFRLPPPYETMCKEYAKESEYVSQDDCMDKCVIEMIGSHMGKFPFTAVTKVPVHQKHVSTLDNKNKTFAREQYALKQACRQKCGQSNCEEQLYVTNFIKNEGGENLRFSIYAMSKPLIIVRYAEKMPFSTYLIQFLSCFGIWFTVDFFSLYEIIVVVVKLIIPAKKRR